MQNYPFQKEFHIHWGDMDALGHVNHAKYLVWFETIRCQLMSELGIEVTKATEIGPILANLTTNYYAPLYFPDQVKVGVAISHVGNSSFTLEYVVTRLEDVTKSVCVASTVLVLFNYKTNQKVAINEELKQKMTPFMKLA